MAPQSSSKGLDPHDGEEFDYALEGRITLMNGDRKYPAKKGETFYINGKCRHHLKNDRENEARVSWVITPLLF